MRTILLIARILAAILLIAVLLRIELWPILIVPFIIHMVVLYAILHSSCRWLGPVMTEFSTDKKEVWLTIDDGPDTNETSAMIKTLRRHDACATFFVIGKKAAETPALVRAIKQNGNAVANHSYSHPVLTGWIRGKKVLRQEITDCDRVLTSIIGECPGIYRSPVGYKPWHLHTVLREQNKALIAWTVRTGDGRRLTARGLERCINRIASNLRPGAILVLHESKGHGPELLERVLRLLEEREYQTVLPSI